MDESIKLLKDIKKQNAEIIDNQNTMVKQNSAIIKELKKIALIQSEVHGIYPNASGEI